MIERVYNKDWPVYYNNNTTRWSPYIYPAIYSNYHIEALNQYHNIVKPKFYYDWTTGKNIDIWC